MDDPNNPPPVWLRIHPAARRLGLTPDFMESAVRRGQLPIRIEEFGPAGYKFVLAADLNKYINQLHPAQGVSA